MNYYTWGKLTLELERAIRKNYPHSKFSNKNLLSLVFHSKNERRKVENEKLVSLLVTVQRNDKDGTWTLYKLLFTMTNLYQYIFANVIIKSIVDRIVMQFILFHLRK